MREMIDRYMAAVWRDEYDVPTGQTLSYFAEIPGDQEYVLDLFSELSAFQLLGDFPDQGEAQSIMMEKLREVASAIPPEVRAKWPSEEDRDYVETCSVCGFTYCPRLPLDAQQHDQRHIQTLTNS
jgi:hypothetical protein